MFFEPKVSIDIGLDVLCVLAKPGQTLTNSEIAYVCDCMPSNIHAIEKKALKKLQVMLRDYESHLIDDFESDGQTLFSTL